MKSVRASFALLCISCLGLADGAAVSSDAGSFLSMQQQLQIISAGAASNRPQAHRAASAQLRKLEKATRAEKKAPRALVQTQSQLHDTAVIGRLEHQLESEENAELQLKQRLASEQLTVKALEKEEIQGTGAMLVVKMWRHRRVLSAVALSMTLSLCIFWTVWQNKSNISRRVVSSFKRDKRGEIPTKPATAGKSDMQQPMPQEVSDQLADLADAVGRVKMPSESSFQVAMQAAQTVSHHEPESF